MNEVDFLCGINTYCSSFHTMNEDKQRFNNKQYKAFSKAFNLEFDCLENIVCFKYNSWLLKE